MKYIFLFCSIIILGPAAFAQEEQLEKGVYALGGSIYYSSSTYETPSSYYNYDQTVFSFTPSISYFVANQLELSFGPGYVYSKDSYPGEDVKETALVLNLGVNYYIPVGKAALFLGGGGQVSWTKYSYVYSPPYSNHNYDPSFSPPTSTYYFVGGAELFIAQSASIEPSIKYARTRYNENVSQHGFIFGIGVKYFIL
jgi:hypothetical protein